MQALLTAIVLWLSANFDLPANLQHPQIAFAPAETIGALHYQAFVTAPAPTSAGADADAVPQQARPIVAVYDDKTKTIYLPKGWTGTTPAEISVLVHEMVHHLQNVGGLRYECAQGREKLAFFAQERWLRMFRSDLSEAFGIDPFTLLVRTNCGY
jgi:hypothetical protein